MSEINLKCKNCGARMQVDEEAKMITCMHCGASHLLSEILDKDDLEFLNKFKPNELENKLKFSDAIKQGETYLFQADYTKAENSFKLAISYDEKNYKGYLGVVKAKTNNFNQLPPTSDYKEYAKSALKYADNDDRIYVKNELEKLNILKNETEKVRNEQEKQKEKQKNIEANKRIKANFFSKLAYFITGLIAVVVLIGLVVSTIIKNKENQDIPATIEISSVQEFLNITQNSKYYKTTIILKNDLDFKNKTISPIGGNKFFAGALRGNGHEIKNLNIVKANLQDNNYIGLFARLDGAKISGLKLNNVKIIYESNANSKDNPISLSVGLIAGYAKNSEISNCEVFDSCAISTKNTNASLLIGGLFGELDGSEIKLSYSNSKIDVIEESNSKAQHLIGGLAGYLNDSLITKCYSSSNIFADLKIRETSNSLVYISGLAGTTTFSSIKSKISHCFFSGIISSASIAKNKIEQIAAISNFDETANANRIYSNYALFENGNFEVNESPIEYNYLADVSNENYVVLFDAENLKEKIVELFSDDRWENFENLKPNLKEI